MTHRRASRHLPAILVVAILLVLVAWPQADVLLRSFFPGGSFSLENYARVFDSAHPANLRALWNSVWTSVASVLLAGAVGVPLAFVVERARIPLRGLLAASLVLPLLLPPIVGVLTFKQFLFGEYGIVPAFLRGAFGVSLYLDGFPGVLALHAYAFFPFFYLFTSASLKRLDPALPEAAESLGASPFTRLRRVVIPLLRPALAGAAVLVLLNALGSFSAPLFFAPDKDLLTLRIASLREEDPATVTVLATLLVFTAFLLLVPLRAFERRTDVTSTGKGLGAPSARRRSRLGALGLGVLVAALAFVLLLPHLSIVLLSFGTDTGSTNSVFPSAFTTQHYERVFTEDAFRRPMQNSLVMAGLAAVADVLLGLAVALRLARRRSAWSPLIELLAYLPLALPATVLAFNLLATFNSAHALTGGEVLAGTWVLLPLAYVIRNLPISVRATQSALASVDGSLVDAASSLGAPRLLVLRRVIVPLVLPGLVSGGLLALLSGLTEFAASLLLYIDSNQPIAVEIFNRRYNRALGEPAALSTLLLLTQTGILLLANRLLRLGKRA